MRFLGNKLKKPTSDELKIGIAVALVAGAINSFLYLGEDEAGVKLIIAMSGIITGTLLSLFISLRKSFLPALLFVFCVSLSVMILAGKYLSS
ncbi:hypothetical protein OCF84_21290 (plasmid) [Shewanella xiamenensis]|uniref:Uncharacterized protein n=1 Tax=Shewanella xiamenensis TaxID=332186 RepID=A0ABT6UDP5_9GAMM|nr:hypothetical protein [Shewanella xiamenensis]MDI5832588.1 hypothetical protein [Shewanella xiamenensis]WHF57794.1 hypothetical protein OCF84_21290 [Shewanella xiamenensis]